MREREAHREPVAHFHPGAREALTQRGSRGQDGEGEAHSERTAVISPFAPGIVIAGKFALQRRIAAGAAGTVFEAWDMFIERKVALKLMHPHFNANPSMVTRFRREAQAAARIQHPNVVSVHEVGKRRDGSFYIVQELLTGRTLREHLNTHHKLPPSDALAIALPVMGGLAAAHASGIVHRDVKPENIVLSWAPSGELVPKIIDFGIAKLVQESPEEQKLTFFLVGTPEYMSPEQANAGRVDGRTDVWAMGMVLFEMLAGVLPYEAESAEEVLDKIRKEPLPRLESLAPHVPRPLAEQIHRALARDPERRFATMQAFREALVGPNLGECGAWSADETATLPNLRRPPMAMPVVVPGPEEPANQGGAPPEAPEPEPPTVRASLPDRGSEPSPASTASMEEWRDEVTTTLRILTPMERADHALSVNALEDAILWAGEALGARGASEDLRGRMWLVQAIAQRWLGQYEAAARSAQEALLRLPRGSTGWHAAFGHFVIACGYLGRKDPLFSGINDMRVLAEEEVAKDAHVVSLCRLVVYVVRAGLLKLAEDLLRDADRLAERAGSVGPFVRAWIDVAHGELALHAGDLTAALWRAQSAADHFTSASDLRNACLQHANVGNVYLQLGAHEQAAAVLQRSLGVAEPMGLDFVAAAKANLGVALAGLERADLLDQAITEVTSALARAQKQGNRRVEAASLTYLARMWKKKGNSDGALGMARAAANIAEAIPAWRAHALATVASLLLSRGQPAQALVPAEEAMAILERLGCVEEGESLIRLVHALALRGTHQEAEGRRRIAAARQRLLQKAHQIGDERWRRYFLEQGQDNARVMAIAAQWMGEA